MTHATDTRPLVVHGARALSGRVQVPGDKSISHRSLIFGGLAIGETVITGLLEGEDVINTAKAMRAMGADVTKEGAVWVVRGRGTGGLTQPPEAIDFGNSGTGVRLMMGVIAGHPISVTVTGDASLSRRPMGRVLTPLQSMGLEIDPTGAATLPLTLKGSSELIPVEYELPVASAQVKSAVLLAGLMTRGTTTVIEPVATRDHTERMLTFFGADISVTESTHGVGRRISLTGPAELRGQPVRVPGDPSSAAFLAAAAVIVEGSDILIENVLTNPSRIGFYTTLQEMGADLSFENAREAGGEPVADIRVRASALRGIKVPADRAPSMIDEYPVLAAVAAFAEGETRMQGLHELRVKECDRLAATSDGLTRNGVENRIDGDDLIVRGSPQPHGGGTVETQLDHRIAMAFAVLGLGTERPITIDDTAPIATSFPQFLDLFGGLGANFDLKEPAA